MFNRQPSFKCKSTLYFFHTLDKNQQQNKMNTNKKVYLIKLLPPSSCCNWTKNISDLWGFKTVTGVSSPVNPEGHLRLIKHCHKSVHSIKCILKIILTITIYFINPRGINYSQVIIIILLLSSQTYKLSISTQVAPIYYTCIPNR